MAAGGCCFWKSGTITSVIAIGAKGFSAPTMQKPFAFYAVATRKVPVRFVLFVYRERAKSFI